MRSSLLAPLTTILWCGLAFAEEVPIILPGAPGEVGETISAGQAIEIADSSYSPDDVEFMQDMIPHHNQAVQMSALVEARTNNEKVREIAGRIDTAQADEIEFMQDWLAQRGEKVPDPNHHHAMHMSHDMAGMASPEDMAELATLDGTGFDQKFLTLMIAHNEGAPDGRRLLDQPDQHTTPCCSNC